MDCGVGSSPEAYVGKCFKKTALLQKAQCQKQLSKAMKHTDMPEV